MQENKIFSIAPNRLASGNTTGTEVEFSSSNNKQGVTLDIYPVGADKTTSQAISAMLSTSVTPLNTTPLQIGGVSFNYYKFSRNIIDVSFESVNEPAAVQNGNLYIIQCDASANSDFFDCGLTHEGLQQFFSTFQFTQTGTDLNSSSTIHTAAYP